MKQGESVETCAVLSALGRDRVGVAGDLAAALASRKIQIETSRMAALKGRFGFIVELRGETGAITSLRQDLEQVGEDLGFHLELEHCAVAPPQGTTREYLIESFSSDSAGINGIMGILKTHNINIEEMETKASMDPWTGGTLHMRALVSIPASSSVSALREELHTLQRGRDLDVVIKPGASQAVDERRGQVPSPT